MFDLITGKNNKFIKEFLTSYEVDGVEMFFYKLRNGIVVGMPRDWIPYLMRGGFNNTAKKFGGRKENKERRDYRLATMP